MEYENNQKGIGYAEKAEQLYHLIRSMGFSEKKYSSNLYRLLVAKQRLQDTSGSSYQFRYNFLGSLDVIKAERVFN